MGGPRLSQREAGFVPRGLQALNRFFETRPRNVLLLICLATAILVGASDFQGTTGLLIFYLAPISLAAWYGGRRVGTVIAVYCATAWFVAVTFLGSGHGVSSASLWALMARLLIFLVLTNVISRLREAMRQQKELIEFIVHDIRSPISSAITGLLTLEQGSDSLPAEDRELIQLALVSNQRALGLVNSMMDMAKLETGKMPIRIERVPLDPLICQSFENVALWAKASNIRLTSDVQVYQGYFDPDLTLRVLTNLISNALKFSPAESEVRVTVSAGSHSSIRFSVQDHGPGIPADYVDSVFEPFSQVKGTKSGTGLGLTFCRLAVLAQGGKIWLETAVGKGTTVHFSLPGRANFEGAAEAVSEPA